MKRIILSGICLMIAGTMISCGNAVPVDQAAETTVAEGTVAETGGDAETGDERTSPGADGETYKGQCETFAYKEYFRNDKKYIGEKIKVDILVDQVIEGDFRGYDADGREYYVSDLRTGEDKFRIMEEDVLTVYGEYAGVQQITRAIGEYDADIFCIDGKYIELHEEGELAAETGIEQTVDAETEQVAVQETTGIPLAAAATGPYADSILLWKSFYEPLTEEDLEGLSISELRFARNELYAAYGRQFTSVDLKGYFINKPWYNGTIPPDQFSDAGMTAVQKENIEMILKYENAREATQVKLTEDVWGVPRGRTHYKSEDGIYEFVINNDGRIWIEGAYIIATGETVGYFVGKQFTAMNDTALLEIGGGTGMYYDDYGTILVLTDSIYGKIKCVYTY